MEPEMNERLDGRSGSDGDRVERLLSALEPADLPPFFTERLLARLRRAGRPRHAWARSPRLAWSVASASVAALIVAVYLGALSPAPAPPGRAIGVAPVMPVDNSIVGAGDVQIVASIEPAIEGGLVRLFLDDRDVTGLAEVAEGYVFYSPDEPLDEGEHIVTIQVRDSSGAMLRDFSWLFRATNGRHRGDERV